MVIAGAAQRLSADLVIAHLRSASDVPLPTGPTAITAKPPHTEGGWSSTPMIAVQWSGASDEAGGSGLAGYSFEWSATPGTDPDAVVDLAHGTDPHSTQAVQGEGAAYFHLRTCDQAGNCSAALHRGPYGIDSTPPFAPGTVSSPSHGDHQPKSDPTIDVAWNAAVDALSGVDGYDAYFDGSASSPCGETKSLAKETLETTSPPLADGTWYVHVCAADRAGNWSPVVHGGPYLVEGGGASTPTIFEDAFETAAPCRWSRVVGGPPCG